jgi:hypothetical protein
MKAREFLDLWGPGEMVRLPEEGLSTLSIPPDSKDFLAEAGLPREAGLRLDFSALPSLEPLPSILARRKLETRVAWGELRVLGGDEASYICLTPQGAIVAVWPGEGLERFVNSSVQQLAECLLAYREISKESDHLAEEAYADDLRRYVLRLDPRALEDEESWWSVVVEQANYGDL